MTTYDDSRIELYVLAALALVALSTLVFDRHAGLLLCGLVAGVAIGRALETEASYQAGYVDGADDAAEADHA